MSTYWFCSDVAKPASESADRGLGIAAGLRGLTPPARLRGATVFVAAVLFIPMLSGCQKQAPAETTSTTAVAPEPIVVTVAPVEVRKVERRVSVVGTLAGFEEFTMTPKVEGRVDTIAFDVGDRVSPGTAMLQLDAIDHRLAVQEAERGLEMEMSKLGVNELPKAEFDVEELPSVVRARLMMENAKRRADRQRNLFQTNASTQELLDQSISDLNVAEASLKQARFDARTTVATVRHRQAILDVSRQKLDETTLRAPRFTPGKEFGDAKVDYVVTRRHVSVSEMVRAFPSTPVFELVIDNILKFRTGIPERHLSQVHIGQKVGIRVEAWPDHIFPATVSRIDPSINSESRTFMVEALVPNLDHRLLAGGFAKAEAVLEENAEAITVPLDAVIQFAGVTKVFRIQNDVVSEVIVRLAGRGPGWVEVLGELKPTDTVVTSGQSKLSDGVAVRVREKPSETPKVAEAPPK
jgi:RND family efflux transporter MFP subunit